MEQRADRAYRLSWSTDHMELYDGEEEIHLREFPGSEWIGGLIEYPPCDLPNPVMFEADFSALRDTDYPISDVNWPVMSRRMYYALLALGDFPHRVTPVAMIDDTSFVFESELRFLPNGQPKPEVTNFNDFVVLQLLERSDYFDFELSQYTRNSRHPEWIDAVEVYVLNEPSEGFPPLFRLNVTPSSLFISAQAREALREAGIRGTAYYALNDGYSLQDEVDIPVPVPTYP
jgi:hypothetical protein